MVGKNEFALRAPVVQKPIKVIDYKRFKAFFAA